MTSHFCFERTKWQFCIAPMIGITNRHCRFFYRLLTPYARLYTEMISTNALLYGKINQLLSFNKVEHPIALQLAGSNPSDLSKSAILGANYGYDEINFNCGCPSNRAQHGGFGACMMAKPDLVVNCIKAMQDVVDIPITIKHRLSLDQNNSYSFLLDFIGKIYEAGCNVFIIHARNAILNGLSPKKNRIVPPLRHTWVYQIKKDFPNAIIVLNGGLNNTKTIMQAMNEVDGIMIGRIVLRNPRILSIISKELYPNVSILDDKSIIEKLIFYANQAISDNIPLQVVLKPILGLMNGKKGSKIWRQTLSNLKSFDKKDSKIISKAWSNYKKIKQII